MHRPEVLQQLLAITVGLALAFGGMAAEIYRWTDEHGKVQFGDRPGGAGASTIKLAPSRPGTAAAHDQNQRTERLLQEFAGERAQLAADRQRARELADKRSEGCRQAKIEAAELNEAGYLYDRREDGSKQILSEAELLKARASAQAAVSRLCD